MDIPKYVKQRINYRRTTYCVYNSRENRWNWILFIVTVNTTLQPEFSQAKFKTHIVHSRDSIYRCNKLSRKNSEIFYISNYLWKWRNQYIFYSITKLTPRIPNSIPIYPVEKLLKKGAKKARKKENKNLAQFSQYSQCPSTMQNNIENSI